MKNQKGLTQIELGIIAVIALIIAAFAIPSFIKYIAKSMAPEESTGLKSIGDGSTDWQKKDTTSKISENESPQSGDRATATPNFFYDVKYTGAYNKIGVDFKLTANDAGKKISGLSIDLAAQSPALPNPTNSSIFANGGGLRSGSNWDCTIIGTTFSCNGKEALGLNKQSNFEFSFASLKNCPEKLVINLLENGAVSTTIMPLLQK